MTWISSTLSSTSNGRDSGTRRPGPDYAAGFAYVTIMFVVIFGGIMSYFKRQPDFWYLTSDENLMQSASCNARLGIDSPLSPRGSPVGHLLSPPYIPPKAWPPLDGQQVGAWLSSYFFASVTFFLVSSWIIFFLLRKNTPVGVWTMSLAVPFITTALTIFHILNNQKWFAFGAGCATILFLLRQIRSVQIGHKIVEYLAATYECGPLKHMHFQAASSAVAAVWSLLCFTQLVFAFFCNMNGSVVPNPYAIIQPDGTCLHQDGGEVVHCCTWQMSPWGGPYLALLSVGFVWTVLLVLEIKAYVASDMATQWYYSVTADESARSLISAKEDPSFVAVGAASVEMQPLMALKGDKHSAAAEGRFDLLTLPAVAWSMTRKGQPAASDINQPTLTPLSVLQTQPHSPVPPYFTTSCQTTSGLNIVLHAVKHAFTTSFSSLCLSSLVLPILALQGGVDAMWAAYVIWIIAALILAAVSWLNVVVGLFMGAWLIIPLMFLLFSSLSTGSVLNSQMVLRKGDDLASTAQEIQERLKAAHTAAATNPEDKAGEDAQKRESGGVMTSAQGSQRLTSMEDGMGSPKESRAAQSVVKEPRQDLLSNKLASKFFRSDEVSKLRMAFDALMLLWVLVIPFTWGDVLGTIAYKYGYNFMNDDQFLFGFLAAIGCGYLGMLIWFMACSDFAHTSTALHACYLWDLDNGVQTRPEVHEVYRKLELRMNEASDASP